MPAWTIPLAGGLLAAAPDLDTFLMSAIGAPYDSPLGHRGVFHSGPFLIVASLLLSLVAAHGHWRPAVRLGALWAICALTHPLLDMLTDGGLGVMLLYPFSEHRFFFGWRPIHVSPLGVARFFSHAGYILKSEAPFDLAAVSIGLAGWLLTGPSTTAGSR